MSEGRNKRMLIVVVLFGTPPRGSDTVERVVSALASAPHLTAGYDLLLWDNSADPWPDEALLDTPYRYHHASRNLGIAGAVNGALDICIRDGYDWILLLDQDTQVTSQYFAGMLTHREQLEPDQSVAAIVPVLHDDGFELSPQRVLRYRQASVATQVPRILEGEVFAANSGMAIRVSALDEIGGYSVDFWLDHSDRYIFHRLYQHGKRVFLAADLRLQHNMTMLDYDARMNPERYANFLRAEQAFLDLFASADENAVQVLRLFARFLRQRRYRNKIYSQMTWKFLLRRLVTAKTRRLQDWKRYSLERGTSLSESEG